MPRHPGSRHAHLAAALLLVLLAALAPASPTRLLAASTSVSADPPSVEIEVPLGQRATRQVTIHNTTDAPLTPILREANVLPSSNAAARPRGPAAAALPAQPERVDQALLATLAAQPEQPADFVVYLRDQADLGGAYGIRDWAERGRYVYATLTGHAARGQRDLLAQLDARGLNYQSFWVVNAVLVQGRLADVQAVANRADVALVRSNHTMALPQPAAPASDDRCSPDEPGNPVCWNIRSIGANRAWQEFGVTGQGIVVANLDTGVSFEHPALAANYRGFRGPGSFDHAYNWFDPQGARPAPDDANGHGTHTMGTIAGAGNGTADQPAVGVAPGARWVAAQGCEGFVCSETDLMAAAQWTLAPTLVDGTQPRPDLRPMVVNNSWAGPSAQPWYAPYTAAWRAAGIFPVFAAGNASAENPQQCGTVASPGDYADVVAVGATNRENQITAFSLLGPTLDGRVKPDFVAPGDGIFSTIPPGRASYHVLRGTSMAAPHVAGLVALLWSAQPSLIGDYEATYAVLRDSARPTSDTRCDSPAGGPNNVYGNGRIDAYGAVSRVLVDVPWLSVPTSPAALQAGGSQAIEVALDAGGVPGPGLYQARIQIFGADLGQAPATISVAMRVTDAAQQATVRGRVISAATGAPIQASVGVAGGLAVQTDVGGRFQLTLAQPAAYDLVVSAPSFFSLRRALELSGDVELTLALQPDQPRLVVSTTPISLGLAFQQQQQLVVPIENAGSKPLNYQVELPPHHYAVARSDEPGGPRYRWVSLPLTATILASNDTIYQADVPMGIRFPFYSYIVTDALLTSDGMLAFDTPLNYNGPTNNCLPDEEFIFYMIAPLRADFDLSRGGTVRYGRANNGQTFVVSYEQVPLRDGPTDQTYTFQLLLHTDGRIVFQYHRLAPLPLKSSAGIQRTPFDVESLGCGPSMPIHDGLAVELRPQQQASSWLAAERVSGTLAPGQRAEIELTARWTRPVDSRPLVASLRINSTDPLRPQVDLPLRLTAGSSAHNLWLPIARVRR